MAQNGPLKTHKMVARDRVDEALRALNRAVEVWPARNEGQLLGIIETASMRLREAIKELEPKKV